MPSDVNSAQVVINRQRAFSGSLVNWTAWIDGQKAGTVANGGTLTVDITPGRHTVIVGPASVPWSPRSEPLTFDAGPGARVDLVAKPSATGRPKIWDPGTAPSRSGLTELLDRAAESATWRRAMEWLPNASGGSPVPSGPATAAPRTPATAAPGPWAAPGPEATAAPGLPATITSKVIEGSRYEVAMGDETRTVDNSKSTSSTQRVVRLSREWSRTCSVDIEHATTVQGSAGLGIHVLDLKAEAERSLSKTYSASSEERETFEEEVTLNIGAGTRSEIVFSWKEIRQRGVVELVGEGVDARIPYEAVVGLTFDQQQIDN